MQYFLTFLEGMVTFVSPCLLPMLPIYLVYFAGGKEGSKGRLIQNILSFILGFTIVFMALGALAGSLGFALRSHQKIVNLITGIIVIFFGLSYLGLFSTPMPGGGIKGGDRVQNLNPGRSFLLGLIFSLAWSPCLGTFLGSALMLAAQAGQMGKGVFMLFLYSMGLGVPFFLSALLLNRLQTAFDWIKEHFGAIQKVSGALLVVLGVLMATGVLYSAMADANPPALAGGEDAIEEEEDLEASEEVGPDFDDFTFDDEYGQTWSISEFYDKPLVVNFWASWCPPCRAEMPDYQRVYQEYGDQVNFVFLNETDGERETVERAQAYLEEEGLDLPVYYDVRAEGMSTLRISSFPTSLFIWKGEIVDLYMGTMPEETIIDRLDGLMDYADQAQAN